jgi:hypothetical protein
VQFSLDIDAAKSLLFPTERRSSLSQRSPLGSRSNNCRSTGHTRVTELLYFPAAFPSAIWPASPLPTELRYFPHFDITQPGNVCKLRASEFQSRGREAGPHLRQIFAQSPCMSAGPKCDHLCNRRNMCGSKLPRYTFARSRRRSWARERL